MANAYVLHGAQRSSATYRVRIALHLKGLAFREILLDTAAGDHRKPEYLAVNPQGLVPTLVAPDGTVVTQSLAIMEYLEETERNAPLLPAAAPDRARVREIAQIVACDVHPVNNMRIRNHIRDLQPDDPQAVLKWTETWSRAGFVALEARLANDRRTGRFCHGDAPTMADTCLVPHVFNARAMGHDVTAFTACLRIVDACNGLPAFAAAHPDRVGAA